MLIIVTIVALMRRPVNIAAKAFGYDNPNRKAAAAPVQAPVTGNGIPTKITNPRNSQVSIILPFRRVLKNNQLKNLSPCGHFLKKLEMGPNRTRIGIEIRKFPATAQIKACCQVIFPMVIAQGKATLSSPMGVIDSKKVIQRGSWINVWK